MKAQVNTSTVDGSWGLELYRYLWPFQSFRDVSLGTHSERRLNYRHNVRLRDHLPLFALKWVLLSVLCLYTGDLCERLLISISLTAVCFVLAVLSFVMTAYITAIYLCLGRAE